MMVDFIDVKKAVYLHIPCHSLILQRKALKQLTLVEEGRHVDGDGTSCGIFSFCFMDNSDGSISTTRKQIGMQDTFYVQFYYFVLDIILS